MRTRIDITDVEQATKIRAKYLRAIEDEEWGLLPGPTFVKSFLRTYADYLGLDSRAARRRVQARATSGSPTRSSALRRAAGGRAAPPAPGRWRAVGIALVRIVLSARCSCSGSWCSGDDNKSGDNPAPTARPRSAGEEEDQGAGQAAGRAPRRAVVKLKVVPTGPVYVCWSTRTARRSSPGDAAARGRRASRSRRGASASRSATASAELRVNGKPRSPLTGLEPGSGYELTPTGPHPAARRPSARPAVSARAGHRRHRARRSWRGASRDRNGPWLSDRLASWASTSPTC